MKEGSTNVSLVKRIWIMVLMIGPAIFGIGYSVGTGSVTSMAKAGSQFGMQLTWVLFLSCLFSWVLMEAFGRFGVITGETTLYGFKKHIRYGKPIAIATMIGIIFAQWNSLTGILGLSANAIYEIVHMFIPGLDLPKYWSVLGIAIVVILIMYSLLLVGRYSFFEKILIVFVTIMGISFIISMFVVMPSPKEIVAGFIPRIPKIPGGKLMVAAFVGTTIGAPTFVVRPLLMKEKGWTKQNTYEQSRDSLFYAILVFIISFSIMAAATGALFHRGQVITKVLDMMYTLEPIAGKYAVALFFTGTLSAGLSSVFPILMVAPLLVDDYRAGKMDTKSSLFRRLAFIACLFGLVVPIFGANPIAAQIATQVAYVFILPVAIIGIILLINKKELMGEHRAGILLNIGLVTSLIFSCFIAYTGILAVMEFFK
ncbi:Nramp family divalent metal transporter [Candidatus Latescibacterota bacterium]